MNANIIKYGSAALATATFATAFYFYALKKSKNLEKAALDFYSTDAYAKDIDFLKETEESTKKMLNKVSELRKEA